MKLKALFIFVVVAVSCGYGVFSVKHDAFPYSQLTHLHNRYLAGELFPDDGWTTLTEDDFVISGLASFEGEGTYYRLPETVRNETRKELKYLSQFPSGGRMTFQTDADRIKIRAETDGYLTFTHMTAIMQYGFDVYVDQRYSNSVAPHETGIIDETVKLGGAGERRVTLYFPLYSKLEKLDVLIPKGSRVSAVKDQRDLMVFYGSSITQGCCASNAGLAFPAIVAREMNYDFVNLGFMGNGLGDLDIARYIASLKAPVLIFDFWANPTPEQYVTALPDFYREVRSIDQNSVIFVLAPFSTPHREVVQREKYASSKQFVEAARALGDQKIFFVEDLLTEAEHDGFVDARHLNSYGNKLVASRLVAALQKQLDQQSPRAPESAIKNGSTN